MNRAFKTEYYPDMTDKVYGKKVLSLSCAVTNGKRFKAMTKKEKENLVVIIERFEKSLTAFKNELTLAI